MNIYYTILEKVIIMKENFGIQRGMGKDYSLVLMEVNSKVILKMEFKVDMEC